MGRITDRPEHGGNGLTEIFDGTFGLRHGCNPIKARARRADLVGSNMRVDRDPILPLVRNLHQPEEELSNLEHASGKSRCHKNVYTILSPKFSQISAPEI